EHRLARERGPRMARRRVPAARAEVWDVDALKCPKCGGEMKVISLKLTRHTSIIIINLRLKY
ncbi:MAG: hypothetical protein K8S15_12535, partial [Candidatus Aegiribacteria sp.]|nr:hypothetical protein [Candidatus Aegiribacteria sp.]